MNDYLVIKRPNLRYVPMICLKELRENTKTFSQDICSIGRDSHRALPEYKPETSTARIKSEMQNGLTSVF
jgi:hypothetical protein